MNSHLLTLFISYGRSKEKLIKYYANSSRVIMSIIRMTTLFYNALILQGEIWCWSLLRLEGLKSYITVISTFSLILKLFLAQISISMYSRLFLGHLFLSVETLKNRYKRLQMILSQENQSMIDFDHFLPSQGFIFNLKKLAHFSGFHPRIWQAKIPGQPKFFQVITFSSA